MPTPSDWTRGQGRCTVSTIRCCTISLPAATVRIVSVENLAPPAQRQSYHGGRRGCLTQYGEACGALPASRNAIAQPSRGARGHRGRSEEHRHRIGPFRRALRWRRGLIGERGSRVIEDPAIIRAPARIEAAGREKVASVACRSGGPDPGSIAATRGFSSTHPSHQYPTGARLVGPNPRAKRLIAGPLRLWLSYIVEDDSDCRHTIPGSHLPPRPARARLHDRIGPSPNRSARACVSVHDRPDTLPKPYDIEKSLTQ